MFAGATKRENIRCDLEMKNDVVYIERVKENAAEVLRQYTKERATEPMKRIKRETLFDGRENDWEGFVKEQVDFFSNARQYIINIELDIENIDRAIEDTMLLIEDTACNVTQGYRMYKNIRDLRVERRAKDRELRCLRAMVEQFDCDAMEAVLKNVSDTIDEVKGKNEVCKFEIVTNTKNDIIEVVN